MKTNSSLKFPILTTNQNRGNPTTNPLSSVEVATSKFVLTAKTLFTLLKSALKNTRCHHTARRITQLNLQPLNNLTWITIDTRMKLLPKAMLLDSQLNNNKPFLPC